MTPALAGCLAGPRSAGRVDVLQHGYAHRNHEPPAAKKAELGAARPAAMVREELGRGARLLAAAFGAQALPVLVPPWNRIAEPLIDLLPAEGYRGLSTHGPQPPDSRARGIRQVTRRRPSVVDWRGGRGFIGVERAIDLAVAHLAARRQGRVAAKEPTGLLTHHLVLEDAAFDSWPNSWRGRANIRPCNGAPPGISSPAEQASPRHEGISLPHQPHPRRLSARRDRDADVHRAHHPGVIRHLCRCHMRCIDGGLPAVHDTHGVPAPNAYSGRRRGADGQGGTGAPDEVAGVGRAHASVLLGSAQPQGRLDDAWPEIPRPVARHRFPISKASRPWPGWPPMRRPPAASSSIPPPAAISPPWKWCCRRRPAPWSRLDEGSAVGRGSGDLLQRPWRQGRCRARRLLPRPVGGTVAIVGEFGLGKSVVSQAIMGILPPAAIIRSGKILFSDPTAKERTIDIAALPQRRRHAGDPRRAHLDHLPGADDRAVADPHHRRPDGRGPASASQRLGNERAARELVIEMLRLVGFPDPAEGARTPIRSSSPAACASGR